MNNPKFIQIQDQKQKLNPQQILDANIMQLSSVVLEKRITEELEKNPMLEIEDEDDTQDDFDGVRTSVKSYSKDAMLFEYISVSSGINTKAHFVALRISISFNSCLGYFIKSFLLLN